MVSSQDWLLSEYVDAFFPYYFSTKKGKCQKARLSRKQPLTTGPWQSSGDLWLWKPPPCTGKNHTHLYSLKLFPQFMTSNLEWLFCPPEQASPESFDGKLASKSISSFKASNPQEAAAVFSRACLEEEQLERYSTVFNALHKNKKISFVRNVRAYLSPFGPPWFLLFFFKVIMNEKPKKLISP